LAVSYSFLSSVRSGTVLPLRPSQSREIKWAIHELGNLLLPSIQIARPERRDHARVVWALLFGYVWVYALGSLPSSFLAASWRHSFPSDIITCLFFSLLACLDNAASASIPKRGFNLLFEPFLVLFCDGNLGRQSAPLGHGDQLIL
jgi:hypothetical protein